MSIEHPLEEDAAKLLDWLELTAIFSNSRQASLDLAMNALEIAEDSNEIVIADGDQAAEEVIDSIAEEVRERQEALTESAYPFIMSKNGETLLLVEELTYGHYAYLACLVLNHAWAGGQLLSPSKPTPQELHNGRNEFEVLASVAAIAISNGGPTFLLGTNRIGAQALLDRIAHICAVVNEGSARANLHPDAPPHANDDKIDIITVEREQDGPPHRAFWFCQSAAGKNFDEKPVINEIARFLEIWFDQNPANTSGAVFLPPMLTRSQANYQTRRLGQLFHRRRLPLLAQQGRAHLQADNTLLHFVQDADSPVSWLMSYLDRVRAIGAP